MQYLMRMLAVILFTRACFYPFFLWPVICACHALHRLRSKFSLILPMHACPTASCVDWSPDLTGAIWAARCRAELPFASFATLEPLRGEVLT